MSQPSFFRKTSPSFPKSTIQGLVLNGLDRRRLRGVWRNAQDTVPIRACFASKIKRLYILPAVDGLSTVWFFHKNINKNSERVE
ncbi:hypothetical protein [Ponticaulis sp.]|uniref:hypothetical protein n=1 Tax=Ponticaulis sp. TaxID=2020902 RepID=UPI0025E28277|nr:hypothetical protein [Ponticaulis sp.]|tara:strand:+ start:57538 stop:57789 length:252 start_codon:yes stop_codon:yes gene_type:complete